MRRTIICKARVVVEKDTPIATREEDTEMAEESGTEARTGWSPLESHREDATERSREMIELEQESDCVQSQVSSANPEEDADEPMDEVSMSGLPGEGREVFVESSVTPDRGSPDIIILDTFDRAEEETARNKGWPN
jgi:hypothetical protein